MTQQPNIKLPTSTSRIKGLLKPQGNPRTWEFVVSDEEIVKPYGVNLNEVNKLPGFPRTKRDDGVRDSGIDAISFKKTFMHGIISWLL